MNKIILIAILFFAFKNNYGQKPPIDTSVFNKWPSLGFYAISNNGNYALYQINNQPVGNNTLIIQSTNAGWTKEFINGSDAVFSGDSKQIIFMRNDTLYFVSLGGNSLRFIGNVASYKKATFGNLEWIAYQLKNSRKELVIQNLTTGKEQHFDSINNYLFSDEGNVLLLETETRKNLHNLQWISLLTGTRSTIWSSEDSLNHSILSSFTFDSKCNRLSFVEQVKKGAKSEKRIWLYEKGMAKANIGVSTNSPGIDSDFEISTYPSLKFNATGDKLFFNLEKSYKIIDKNKDLASVDIWNYKDEYLQSEQPFQHEKKYFAAVLRIGSNVVIRLEDDKDFSVNYASIKNDPIGSYLISQQFSYAQDFWWHKKFSQKVSIVSTNDGSRKSIIENSKSILSELHLSPGEKFVVWYNTVDNNYYSYELSGEETKKISVNIPYPLYDDDKESPNKRSAFGIVGWLKEDKGLFVYDRYDIWQVDPKGQYKPINITNGYGRKNHFVLGVADQGGMRNLSNSNALLLAAFDRKTKLNGFFEIKLGSIVNPKDIKMLPYSFCIPRTVPYMKGVGSIYEDISCGFPVKAKNTEMYITPRMSAEESPNLFISKDFRSFKELSDIHPEKKYNWLTTELLQWKMLDGKLSHGILYKPENFDVQKKYPVILYYYEEKSDGLHMYLPPRVIQAIIDIPYFVSNGYLVFVPDIYFQKGHVGQGTVNSVVSAGKFLSQFPWVNAKKMGIQGQSFGGYETNYLVTHSNIFAAACEGSGTSDVISSYGQLAYPGGGSEPRALEKGLGNRRYPMYEVDQSYIGATPWERPDLYMENSAIFTIDKATTPLLIWHCKGDGGVPFEQAVEMFIGMRRAEKKVWLLQYDGDGHAVFGRNAVDLDIRMKQFFDHYLKDAPAPIWMTEGVQANQNRLRIGYFRR